VSNFFPRWKKHKTKSSIPYVRLLRNEVESLVNEKYGNNYLKNKKLKNELAQVTKEINRLKKQLASLERKKAELLENIDV